jgi:hypothetical protein
LNDSVTANLIFDSGFSCGDLMLDSSFVAAYISLPSGIYPYRTSQDDSPWSDGRNATLSLYYKNIVQTVKTGNTTTIYKSFEISNLNKLYGSDGTDGIFNIPADDTTHVWELNFDHNYLEIHSAGTFQMPENSFLCPLVGPEHHFCIHLPMQIRYANDDTLTSRAIYLIDTGAPQDIIFMHSTDKELTFFNKYKENVVWTESMGGYNLRYTVGATLFDNYYVDSLRIYTFSNSNRVEYSYFVGINFLKRFNVFFDMKNRQMGLQPIKNFRRIVNPNHRRFFFSSHRTPNETLIVDIVADYRANYYKNAGLREGDEIVSINDKPFKDITDEEKLAFNKIDTFVLDIIRNGQMLQIVVPVNKTLENGD